MGTRKKPTDLLYLFDRISEPVFTPKGENYAVFDIPASYLTERYQPVGADVLSRFGEAAGEHIDISQISIPDISVPMQLGRQESFSLFLPRHRHLAARLIEIFMGMRTYNDLLSVAVYCRDRVNPLMFIYALSVAILHRPDTKNVAIPSLAEIFPERFVNRSTLARAREETNVMNTNTRVPIEIPRDYTASDLEPEHRLAYFREDIGVSLHHWHWRLVFPFDGPMNIVNKDRRGELFFYMHQQLIARYNFERFCNNMARVKRLFDWREPIEEGYFPKLDTLVASRVWPPRHSGATLKDINREDDQIKFDIQDLERWRDRIYEAIHKGQVVNDRGETVNLTEMTGIDVLGNVVESSILSPNRTFYGNLHNFGHLLICLCHDPDNRHLESIGCMGEPAVAMRDPLFYRHHAFVDDIFQEHKNTLPRYTVQQLDYSGITVPKVEIITKGSRAKNEFITHWKQDDVNMSRGLDFTPRGPIYARYTHLQYTPFSYKIQVENNSNSPRMGTVRIFLAPQVDERGLPLLFVDQRTLFIEMDKFTIQMKPRTNIVERESSKSWVTIPFDQTFRNLDENRPTDDDPVRLDEFNFCGCGWPNHLLLPKGKPEGMRCHLFVMVSNYDDDKIDQVLDGTCDGNSFCGIRDKKYPDKRSMGYPFDRLPRNGVDTLDQFLTPNMRIENVTIRFEDRVEPPGVNSSTRRN